MVRKITGVDDLVKSVVDRLGNLEAAYLVGDYARGVDAGIIDVVLVGDIDRSQLDDFVASRRRTSTARSGLWYSPVRNSIA